MYLLTSVLYTLVSQICLKLHTFFFIFKRSCNNKETAIIGSAKWSHIAGDPSGISIDMFAFRFTTYAEVVIGCTAFVCSDKKKDKCTQVGERKDTYKSKMLHSFLKKRN